MGLTLDMLNEVRGQIAADPDVLRAAGARRDLVGQAARKIPGALRWFSSGSLAHRTVNRPVTDADSGIVLDRRSYPMLGPDSEENEGPEGIIDELIQLVEPCLKERYRSLEISTSRRGLLIEFNAPLADDQDPSVDLIVTLTRKEAPGLWIPDLKKGGWTPSDPEKHTELFTSGTQECRQLRARVIRLAKAWNKQYKERDRPLSSFNIEALAWEYVEDGSVSLDEALAGWFRYARDEIEKANTQDPAGVSEPIRLLLSRAGVVKRLGAAADRLDHALSHEDDEDAVRDDLALVFQDYVEPPPGSKAAWAAALRDGNQGVGATPTGLVIGTGAALKTTPAYGASRDG